MKRVSIIIIYLTLVNYMFASSSAIWQIVLSDDANSQCVPCSIINDVKNKEIIILGACEQTGTKENRLWVWKIEQNGKIKNAKSLGQISRYDGLNYRTTRLVTTFNPNTSNIARLYRDDINNFSMAFTDSSLELRNVKMNLTQASPKGASFYDMIFPQKDNLVLIGNDPNGNGTIIKTDLSGNLIWKKVFDNGNTEILFSAAGNADGTNLYAAGISAKISGRLSFAEPIKICVLNYDGNGELKAKDLFEGGISTLPMSYPKVVCLPSGIVCVVYDKSKNVKSNEICLRAYNQKMEFLFEKQILNTEVSIFPAYFDICTVPNNHLVFAAIVNLTDLRLFEYDEKGNILQKFELNGVAGEGINIYVDFMDGQIYTAFGSNVNQKAKIKLLAVKPYSAN